MMDLGICNQGLIQKEKLDKGGQGSIVAKEILM